MPSTIELNLQKGHSNELTKNTVQYIGANQERFNELMDVFLEGDTRLSQRASWALILCLELQPHLGNPHYERMAQIFINQSKPIGVRRNIIRTFQTCYIPESIESELYDYALRLVIDPQETVALRVFSMSVCERIVKKYPDLKNEFIPAVKSSLIGATPGIKSRASKILKRWQ